METIDLVFHSIYRKIIETQKPYIVSIVFKRNFIPWMELTAKIIETAEELFMQFGIKSVSMDDISQKLGISKKTLYKCVENKQDLINLTITNYDFKEKKKIEKIIEDSKDALDEQLNLARHVISLLRRMKPTLMHDLQKYYLESWQLMQRIHLKFIEEVIRKNLEKGKNQGLYRKHLNPIVIAKLYVGKTSLLLNEKLFPVNEFNMHDLFREYIFYHLHGIISDKGYRRLEELKKII